MADLSLPVSLTFKSKINEVFKKMKPDCFRKNALAGMEKQRRLENTASGHPHPRGQPEFQALGVWEPPTSPTRVGCVLIKPWWVWHSFLPLCRYLALLRLLRVMVSAVWVLCWLLSILPSCFCHQSSSRHSPPAPLSLHPGLGVSWPDPSESAQVSTAPTDGGKDHSAIKPTRPIPGREPKRFGNVWALSGKMGHNFRMLTEMLWNHGDSVF